MVVTRGRQASGTKDAIMATAERLFAEHGVTAVSSRQISEAAGQGNNAAVGYHFGAKADLIRAIVHRHDVEIERSRRALVERVGETGDVRAWVECLVLPLTEHLSAIGRTSWYARFSLQVTTDPVLRQIITDEIRASAALARIGEGLLDGLAALPEEVRRERFEMVRSLLMHTCADRERAIADSGEPPNRAWSRTATLLVDAITGLLLAPDSSKSAP
ncbi:MAG TPA: TetR family transcriptional regulator [Actinospica sp.]|nr:TetR family transcriptional regulator [Actinospica sp.]